MTTALSATAIAATPVATPPPVSDPLEYLSASRLKLWQDCRLKWYFRYVEQIPSGTSVALIVGKVVHSVLQAWNLARWRGEDASPTEMEHVFHDDWPRECDQSNIQWDSSEQESKEKAKCWNLLHHYLEQTPIPMEEKPEAVEVKVERDLDAHGLPPLLGIIDLVRQGGRIVDFKTTARTPDPPLTAHSHELQLGCYALLYREATGKKESGFEIQSLVKTKQPKLVVTPLQPLASQQIRRLVTIMESYVRGVEAKDFTPSPGLQCSYCDYFAECRQWLGTTG